MIFNISNSYLQYNAREIKREAKEVFFTFHAREKFVSLVLEVLHYYLDDEGNKVYLPNLDYARQLIATNNSLVYGDNGDYVEWEEVEEVMEENGETITYKKKIPKQREGASIVGEYSFFEFLRNSTISINHLIANIVTRADNLKMLD